MSRTSSSHFVAAMHVSSSSLLHWIHKPHRIHKIKRGKISGREQLNRYRPRASQQARVRELGLSIPNFVANLSKEMATLGQQQFASIHPPCCDLLMSDFETVGKISDFEEGRGRAIPVDGRMVAVFRRGDNFYTIDDLCPHMGASLAEGYLDEETVTCPWHAWRFCIKDGTWEDNPRVKVDAFEIRVEGDEVQVRVND